MDEFLDLPRHILEVVTTEEHNKHEILVVGRSGCAVMLKNEARSVCTRTRGCSSARATNKSKKIHCLARTRTEFCWEC